MNELAEIKTEISNLQERNKRVEGDKAWEKSVFRKLTICLITYITADIFLYFLGIKDFYLSAMIPTAGFFLSTLTLPTIKKWWIKNYF